MTREPFAPKDAETIKSELLTELAVDYEGNEHIIDPLVERELKNEEFKASLHDQKEKNKISKDKYKEQLVKAGFDPETGEKIAKDTQEPKGSPSYSVRDIRALAKVHDDDVERVEKFAKAEGLTIADALANEDLVAILDKREEKRQMAQASNTGGGGSMIDSDDAILQKISKQEDMSDSELQRGARLMVESLRPKQ